MSSTRRVFIHRLTFLGGGVVLLGGGGCSRDRESPPPSPASKARSSRHQTFTNEEYITLSAAVERLFPHDEDPGAIELGVPIYIDRMLTAPELAPMRDDLVAGINALERRSRGQLEKSFATATAAEQDALLREFKDAEPASGEAQFFELLTALTFEGVLGDPSYGGNKDRAGWALMGFETSQPMDGYEGTKHLHNLRCDGSHECR
jgi:gluconate 2-dehydrogenase gamma chain